MIRLSNRHSTIFFGLVAGGALWLPAGSARACIRLEWRVSTPVADLDTDIDIGLYAVGVPDNPQDDADDRFIAADIFFRWDNAYLLFMGVEASGDPRVDPTTGLLCPDTFCLSNENCPVPAPGGMYLPPSDGDGLYQMTTRLQQKLTATPEGYLLANFRFRTVAVAPAACVEVQAGLFPCSTRVFDDVVPNVDILYVDGRGDLCVEIVDIPCEPVFYTLQPTSDIVCEGATITLIVEAQGTPPLAYQWRKEGVTIPGETSATYVLSNTDESDTANYDVVVTNECGSLVSDAATVVVWPIGTSDANGDGVVDGLDISPFMHVVLASPNGPPDIAFCAADLNHDGVVNMADVQLFVAALLAP